MADRVYGKRADTDDDIRRIEEADAMAKALAALAEQYEQQTRPRPTARTREGDVDPGELVWITPADVDAGDEEADLVWRGADAADHASRIEDALSARLRRTSFRGCPERKAAVDARHLDGCTGRFYEQWVSPRPVDETD